MDDKATEQDPIEQDQFDRIGQLFAVLDRRVSSIEAATKDLRPLLETHQKGLVLLGNELLAHRQVFPAIALALNEILEGTAEGSTAAKLRKALGDIEELEKLLAKDPDAPETKS